MKRTLIYSLFLLIFASCDILDKDIDTSLSKEDVFSDERFAQGFLNSSYRSLINGFNRLDNAMFACAGDEAICSYSGSAVHGFNNGAISPYYNPEEVIFANMYAGIRSVNLFLQELDGLIKAAGLIEKDEKSTATYHRMTGEALFLRAMYHFELAKRFGNVQYVNRVITAEEVLVIPQLPFVEMIDSIVSDCEKSMGYLEYFNADAADYGRATKLSAMALKSRALLYKASPLNNPDGNKQWWKDAADAAWEIMEVQKSYASKLNLMSAYHTIFTTPYNMEIIFAAGAENTNAIELYNNPISYGGKGYTNPTQELVDAYEMVIGKPITDPTSGYDPQNPYKGRDARLDYSIGYNGLRFAGEPIETFVGGKDGLNKSQTATKTGYYMRKFIDQNLNLAKGESRRRPWIFFRYAEVLLNYAEAMNEYLGTPDQEVYSAINAVRKRARIKNLPNGLSQEEMRARIKNERRVELAFEEHRFWDVRRWGEGMTYFNAPIHGMKITKSDDGMLHYEVFEVESRVYDSKMDYYPLPFSELQKNPNLQQNSGW